MRHFLIACRISVTLKVAATDEGVCYLEVLEVFARGGGAFCAATGAEGQPTARRRPEEGVVSTISTNSCRREHNDVCRKTMTDMPTLHT